VIFRWLDAGNVHWIPSASLILSPEGVSFRLQGADAQHGIHWRVLLSLSLMLVFILVLGRWMAQSSWYSCLNESTTVDLYVYCVPPDYLVRYVECRLHRDRISQTTGRISSWSSLELNLSAMSAWRQEPMNLAFPPRSSPLLSKLLGAIIASKEIRTRIEHAKVLRLSKWIQAVSAAVWRCQ